MASVSCVMSGTTDFSLGYDHFKRPVPASDATGMTVPPTPGSGPPGSGPRYASHRPRRQRRAAARQTNQRPHVRRLALDDRSVLLLGRGVVAIGQRQVGNFQRLFEGRQAGIADSAMDLEGGGLFCPRPNRDLTQVVATAASQPSRAWKRASQISSEDRRSSRGTSNRDGISHKRVIARAEFIKVPSIPLPDIVMA